jgi:threonyl-tRNA synthetase
VRNDHEAYAAEVVRQLAEASLRVDTEQANEPLGGRIRRAKLEKLPYILVVGDSDVAAGTVGVNGRGDAQPERGVLLADFVVRAVAEAGEPIRGATA